METAAPKCACPVISRYVLGLSDSLNHEDRQKLEEYFPRILNARDDNAQKRAEILAIAAVTRIAPHAIELAGFKDEADKMRDAKTFQDAYSAARAAGAVASAAARAAFDAATFNPDADADARVVGAANGAAVSAADAAAIAGAGAVRLAEDATQAAKYAAVTGIGTGTAINAASGATRAAEFAARAAVNDSDVRKAIIQATLDALDDILQVSEEAKEQQ